MFFNNLITLLAMTIVMVCSPVGPANATYNVGAVQTVQSSNASIMFLNENVREVKPGDNAWNMAKDVYYDGYRWVDIVAQNSFLREPGRIYYDSIKKIWFCLMKPGEKIVMYNEVLPMIQKQDSVVDPQPPGEKDKPVIVNEKQNFPWWIFLVLLALIVLFFIAGRIWSNADVVTSGPAQIIGGVNPGNIVGVLEQRTNGRVISIHKVRLYGRGKVHYNFSPMSIRNILNESFGKTFKGEEGYEAIILMPDNTRKTVYCLQACGNDAAQGNFMTGLIAIRLNEQPSSFVEINNVTPPVVETPVSNTDSEQKKDVIEVKSDPEPKNDFVVESQIFKIMEKAIDYKTPMFVDAEKTVHGWKIRLDTLNTKNPKVEVKKEEQTDKK